MKYFLLICFFLVNILCQPPPPPSNQDKNLTKEQVKELNFTDLRDKAKDLMFKNETIQAALESLEEKLKDENDNPFNSPEDAKELFGMIGEFCNETMNETQVKKIFEEVEKNIKAKFNGEEKDKFCDAAKQYLNVSEFLAGKNNTNENSEMKENKEKAMNLYLACAKFEEGTLNLSLQNSNVSMKTINPSKDNEVNITSGKNRIKINKKMMERLKELAGTSDDVIISITSANKNQAGLSKEKTKNLTVSEIITAEFKKKTTDGVEDITVGQLNDGITMDVEFSESVQKKNNMCARYENEKWVESGKFQDTGDEEKSNICSMNHASEYSIVGTVTKDEATINATEFAARFEIWVLMFISFLLFL